jgi:hypothetical protein
MATYVITQRMYELVTRIIALHSNKQEITAYRLGIEINHQFTNHEIEKFVNQFEQKGFVKFQYGKNLRKIIIPTDSLYMLHKLMTLTCLLLSSDPKYYDIAPKVLKQIIQYLEVNK